MGSLVNSVTDAFGLTDSQAGARATRAGYGAMEAAQREGLDYLKEVDKLPRQYRESAMTRLADIYGFGDEGAQQSFYDNLSDDPFYAAIMDTLDSREDAFLRSQSATGDLRGGASVVGVGDVAQGTEQQALLSAYQNQLSGIQSLMNLPDYTKDIYSGTVDIGDTVGRGKIAYGQALEDAEQAGMDNLMGFAQLGVGAGLGVPGGFNIPSFGMGNKSARPRSGGQQSLYRSPIPNL